MRNINWTYLAARVIVFGFMAGAARYSYSHLSDLATWLGCSREESAVAPIFVDGFAGLGWLMRRPSLDATTRRVGMRLMVGAGLVSFAGNVGAGHTVGSRAFGALVVLAFVVAEQASDRLRPAPAAEPTTSEVRAAAARKAAQTRRVNQARKAAEAVAAQAEAERREAQRRERRKLARQVRDLEVAVAGESAPVSPVAGYL